MDSCHTCTNHGIINGCCDSGDSFDGDGGGCEDASAWYSSKTIVSGCDGGDGYMVI